MPYHIEVMSLGEDIYPVLDRAAKGLNGIQDQFSFEVTHPDLRAPGLAFQRDEYLSTDIWQFLKEQRAEGAPRPFIIAFVTRDLRSPQYRNLFGSHCGEDGIAVVTTSSATQYVKEAERYCRYYLVRYALSFVNWLIKAHEDEARKDCYFHFKRDKRDILLSIDSGKICDECMARLDKPPVDSKVHRLTPSERKALAKMRQYVSGDHPYSIVMKGGGIKGLALAGALLELEKYFWFDRHVGTSAGAIAAALLAGNFTPTELRDLFLKKNFADFLDAPIWKVPLNLIVRQGLYPGEAFRLWIADLLTKKLGRVAEVCMQDLDRAVIYAARAGQGTLVFDSRGPRRETVASFAVRCSMSIPIFFMPTSIDGRRVFDGGLRNNFPLKRFLDTFPNAPFIALYLGKPNNQNNRLFSADLLDIVIDGEERELIDRHSKDVVVIDTSPISTFDFRLTAEEKDFLLKAGKAAALELLHRRQIDHGPTLEEVQRACEDAELMRAAVIIKRKARRVRRWTLGGLIVAVIAILLFARIVSS